MGYSLGLPPHLLPLLQFNMAIQTWRLREQKHWRSQQKRPLCRLRHWTPSYHIIWSSLDRILNCFFQIIRTLIFGSRWKHHDSFKLFANTLESLGWPFRQGTDVSTVAWSTVTCRVLQFTILSSLGRCTVALVWTRSVAACAIVKTRIYEKLVPQSVLSSTSCTRFRFETL